MDKISKFLARLTVNERTQLELILISIKDGTHSDLDIKKLRGYSDIFRARIGTVRVIYQKNAGAVTLLSISRRNEKTYRDF